MPVEKGQLWVSTGDMSPFSLRCKRPDALAVTEHEHRAVRGSMKVRFEDEQDHWVSSGFVSGIYTPACCEAYWHCMSQYIMTGQSDSREVVLPRGRGSGFPDSVAVVDKDPCGQQVQVPESDVNVSGELTPQERAALEKELSEFSAKMIKHWNDCAEKERWDEVRADLSVY
eukprot:s6174_g1.t1